MYEREQELATEIVAEVCGLTLRVQDGIVAGGEALAKDDRSPVTVADIAAQVLVSRRLAMAFPGDPLLAEEDSAPIAGEPVLAEKALDQVRRHLPGLAPEDMVAALDRGGHHGGDGGRYWVLDPIDGTKGFLRGDQYAVALALVAGGRVVVGVLGCPNLPPPPAAGGAAVGFVFSAAAGRGATARQLGNVDCETIRVDDISDPADAVLCESVEAAHAAHSVQGRIAARLGLTAPSRRIDSQCKYAVVARGEASIYLRLPRDPSYREKVWDHAAGVIVVEEAGGRVSDLDGRPLDFSNGRLLGEHRGIVCTNGAIHDQVLAACRAELGR